MKNKQKTVRKIISIFCAITLLFSAAFVLNTDATVISEVVDGDYTEINEVVFDCGYDNAVTEALTQNLPVYYYNSRNFSGDLRAVNGCKTATEKYLWYTQSSFGLGVAVLGYDYSGSGKQDSSASNSAITIKKGLTYKVEFDYLILGTLKQDLSIGLAIGKAINNFESGSFHQGSFYQNVLTYTTEIVQAAGATPDASNTMLRCIAYISAPEDGDLSEYNSLLLYAKGGGTGLSAPTNTLDGEIEKNGVLFDNIKVTATNLSKTVFDCSYDNAVTTALNSTLYPHDENAYNFSGDLRAVNGCKTATEKYLWYSQSWYGLGVAVLGYDYSGSGKQDSAASDNAIKVQQGKTYRVEFDYLILGEMKYNLTIGLAVGAAINNFSSGEFNQATFSNRVLTYTTEISQTAGIAPNETDTMQHCTAYITVPNDADLSTYDSLLLYAKGGGTGLSAPTNTLGGEVEKNGVIFDNIKVSVAVSKKENVTATVVNNNWGFEDGTIEPFVLESGALGKPVGNRTTEFNSPYRNINKSGTYYLNTIEITTSPGYSDGQKATMVSPKFRISGTQISMKLAGGKSGDAYVALCDANTDKELKKAIPVANEYIFHDVVMDIADVVSEGDEVYLKIVDNTAAGYGFIAVDDISFDSLVDVTDVCFDFESGMLEPFYLFEGNLNANARPIGTRSVNLNSPYDSLRKEGVYYYSSSENISGGYSNAYTSTVRSSLFAVETKNDPVVTFKIGGGTDTDKVFVRLCKADGTVIAKATSSKDEYKFEEQSWDLTGLVTIDDLLYLEIVDNSTTSGIIFDNFSARGIYSKTADQLKTEEETTAITGWSTEKFENLKKSVENLMDSFGDSYTAGEGFLAEIQAMKDRHDSFYLEGALPTDSHVKCFASDMEELKTRIALSNPYIASSQMMIVTRNQYAADHHNTHTMFPSVPGEHNDGYYSGGGAVKTVNFSDKSVSTLLSSSAGVFRDPDVSYDGTKFLISYRENRSDSYHIYEYSLNETNTEATLIKKLTSMYGADDMDPMYMPSGNIVFTSTREPKYVQCNRQISANIYRMESDGANIIQLTNNTLFDRVTDILSDGRILYDRWEYVDRDFSSAQGIWTVHEDGTQQVTYYGNNSPTGSVIDAKAIPNSDKIAAILTSTHDRPWGAFAIIDHSKGVDGKEAVVMTYPQSAKDGIKEAGAATNEDAYKELEIKYEDPQPLSEDYFLVSRQINAGVSKMGIYMLDSFGNETLLYEDSSSYGAYDAILIQPRVKEIVISESRDYTSESGKFVVQNVYKGTSMSGVAEGSVKSLRIVEAVSKYTITKNNQWNGQGQQNPGVNWHSFEVKRVIGEVPVYEDGSAYFEVPDNTFVYFQLLDEDGKMIQSMRSGTLVQSGETVSCIGCHENRASSVPSYNEKNLDAHIQSFKVIDNPDYTVGSNLPKKIGVNVPDTPKKRTIDFTTGTDTLSEIDLSDTDELPTMNYLTEIQPIFTKHCISCHGYDNPAADLTLVPDKGLIFNASYVDLWRTRTSNSTTASSRRNNYVGVIAGGNTEFAEAMSWGSYASPLIQKIFNDASHSVLLTEAEKRKICEWVDLNATYYGDYSSNYASGAMGRCPLTLAELTEFYKSVPELSSWGASFHSGNKMAMPVYFDNPEKSPLLKNLSGEKYTIALNWINIGRQRLIEKPDVDWRGLTVMPGNTSTSITPYTLGAQDSWRMEKVKLRQNIEEANLKAIASGTKRYDSDNTVENGLPDWPSWEFPGFDN